MSEIGCSRLHWGAEVLLPPAYGVVDAVVVREDELNMHVSDDMRNVE